MNVLHCSLKEGEAIVTRGKAQGQIPPMSLKVHNASGVMGSGDHGVGKWKTWHTLTVVSREKYYANPTDKRVMQSMVVTVVSSWKSFVIVRSGQHLY